MSPLYLVSKDVCFWFHLAKGAALSLTASHTKVLSDGIQVSLPSEYEVIAISGNQLSTVSDLCHKYMKRIIVIASNRHQNSPASLDWDRLARMRST